MKCALLIALVACVSPPGATLDARPSLDGDYALCWSQVAGGHPQLAPDLTDSHALTIDGLRLHWHDPDCGSECTHDMLAREQVANCLEIDASADERAFETCVESGGPSGTVSWSSGQVWTFSPR